MQTPQVDPVQPQALRHAAEVLGEILHAAQRRLAAEAATAAHAREPEPKSKPDPPDYVDLTPYEGMNDRDVLLALGVRKGDVRYYKDALERQRRAESLHAARGEERCEAGIAANFGLRCTLAALPGERWCRRHHPQPPVGVLSATEQARVRLRHDQLWQRPDGRVIEAIYALTDSVEELCATTREVVDRAQRLESAAADPSTWLNIDEAAAYTRRSRASLARAANSGELSGVRETARGPWSFRPTDLDKWLEDSRYNSGRYRAAYEASRNRPLRRR